MPTSGPLSAMLNGRRIVRLWPAKAKRLDAKVRLGRTLFPGDFPEHPEPESVRAALQKAKEEGFDPKQLWDEEVALYRERNALRVSRGGANYPPPSWEEVAPT